MNLFESDKEIGSLVALEQNRQESTLELIASENHVSPAVMQLRAVVSPINMPRGTRPLVTTAVAASMIRLKPSRLNAPRSSSTAISPMFSRTAAPTPTLQAFLAMMAPGDKFLSLNLASGGHLSHGMKLNASAIFYKPDHYELDDATCTIDFESVRKKALEVKPKMILCGYSAYPRIIDFKKVPGDRR